jgi:hypothetical protein
MSKLLLVAILLLAPVRAQAAHETECYDSGGQVKSGIQFHFADEESATEYKKDASEREPATSDEELRRRNRDAATSLGGRKADP